MDLSGNSTLQSPLHCGARRGMVLGAWLSGMFVMSMLGESVPLASLLFFAMALCVPVMVYKWLRHTYKVDGGFTTLSGLWMQGITMFGGGSLICTTVAIGYFRWINPDFVWQTVTKMIEIYSASAMSGASTVADTLQSMLDAGVLPSASDIALEMFWLTMFAGSILSLVCSLIVRSRRIPVS